MLSTNLISLKIAKTKKNTKLSFKLEVLFFKYKTQTMRKLVLSIAIVGLFATAAQAQDAKKQPVKTQTSQTAEQQAEEQTKKAVAILGLTDDQQAKFKAFAIEKMNVIVPIREKAQATTDKTQKQALQGEVKAAREKFFTNVNGILNPDQQTKWAEHKKKMQEKEAGGHADHQD
jgi:hypothetical protein